MITNFKDFLFEHLGSKIDWIDMDFRSHQEMEVADVAEETLQSKYLIVFYEHSSEFEKFKQHASAEQGEKVLETDGHELTLFTKPVEFLMWNSEIETQPIFIIRGEDYDKI